MQRRGLACEKKFHGSGRPAVGGVKLGQHCRRQIDGVAAFDDCLALAWGTACDIYLVLGAGAACCAGDPAETAGVQNHKGQSTTTTIKYENDGIDGNTAVWGRLFAAVVAATTSDPSDDRLCRTRM